MLTIKHVAISGDETVRQAMEVRLAHEPIPQDDQLTSADTHKARVYADLEDNATVQIESGTVYVMNDAGATVSKYDLGGWRGPQAI